MITDLLDPMQKIWYIFMHNWFLVIGAVSLWGTFILLALIARRYELVFHRPTKWQYMLIAPSGILIYAVLLTLAYTQGKVIMPISQRWVAYIAFLMSGVLSLGGALQFMHLILPALKKG